METYHPVRRMLRKVRRGILWVLGLPNVKLMLFLLFAILFATVPPEFYQRKSTLLFFLLVAPFIVYVLYLAFSTAGETTEYIAGHRRSRRHDHD